MSKVAKIQILHYTKTGRFVNKVIVEVPNNAQAKAVIIETFKKYPKHSEDIYKDGGKLAKMKSSEKLIPVMNTNIMVFVGGKLTKFSHLLK